MVTKCGPCGAAFFAANFKSLIFKMLASHSPQAALDRVMPLLPAFGITRIANVTGLDRLGVPVFMVCRPNSKSLAVFQGKGITDTGARVSGLMEAIECFHAETPPPPSIYEASSRLHPGATIDLARLSRLKNRTYDADTRFSWMAGRDLLNGGQRLVPAQCVHMDCTMDALPERQIFVSDTSGLASGLSMPQAMVHGLCEVIERDALALWSFTAPSDRQTRKIITNSIADPFIQAFIESCDAAGAAVGIWDITTEIGLPTFICKVMTRDYEGNGVRPAYGSGTHTSRMVALYKAVTEAAQSRITFIAGARDDQFNTNYAHQLSPDTYHRWHSDVVEQQEILAFDDTVDSPTGGYAADCDLIVKKLAASGFSDIVSVDLSKPDFDISVCKIIVPGLEGISCSGMRVIGARGHRYLQMREGRS